MADKPVFSAQDIAFEASDIQFDDEMRDAPSAGGGGDSDLRDIALSLARHIFGKAVKQEAPGFSQTIEGPTQYAEGLLSGLRREKDMYDEPLPKQVGNAATRAVFPAAGAVAGAALAPAAPAALASFAGPAVAGALTSAAATGAGAASGDLASMGVSGAVGGEVPESVGAALSEAGKTGLETAAGELGFTAGLAALSKLAPSALQVFAKIPAESIKRGFEKPEVIRIGTQAKTRVEIGAQRALRDAQKAIEAARKEKGQAVDRALVGFSAKTGGQPVIDTSAAAQGARKIIEEVTGGGDRAVKAALKSSEMARIMKVIRELEKSPNKTVSQAVQLRRNLDDLSKFKAGGLQDISSDAGQRAVKELAAGLRKGIDDAATKFDYTALREANRDLHEFAKLSDEIAEEIGTKSDSPKALRDAVEKISARFNKGGDHARSIARLAERAPQMAKPIERMLDMIAARSLTKLPEGTPSGFLKDILKFVQAPQVVGLGTKIGAKVAPAGKVGRRAALGAAASRQNQE